MNKYIVFLFAFILGYSQNPLVISSPTTTSVRSPANKKTVIEIDHSTVRPNGLGYGSQWIWIEGPDANPEGFRATF